MRILFDTHTLIWFLSDSPHLTPQARGLLSREGVEIFFSPISIEEIAIKHSLKPEVMPCEPSEVLADALASGLREIPFDAQAAVAVCGDLSVTDDKGNPSKNWTFDCSAATENLLLAAEALGLGAVWTGVYP